ncbi:S8 family peptidase [Pseudidiomarina marina]|uniref:Peptidase S8/S53 subtilisin kexin sedolisin n=1 Tax=Pseudidiomarina marina TaxID=502366 RepID=A0A432YD43_9GAMM|nr:S8 family serine peptidase [Pseudidiomarina marina]PHR65790.1 MAG: peptidase S8/S53 subtilisin kexin sedolisin [Idiomarina sp.]RUO58884.1 peptidase S8/S53 subtilisin kexin sedolisin [Pseudidiomarina marina]
MNKKLSSLGILASGLLITTSVQADALLDPKLAQDIETKAGPYEVIVSFDKNSNIDPVLQNLGIPYLSLKTMPMAGATVTKGQLEALIKNSAVSSIYANAPLQYSNYTSGEITGGHYVHDYYGLDGHGVTIAVLDSGVDATHPDLEFQTKTIENVKILGDLDLLGGRNAFIEGVPNSDTTSGHGTHVAGTVAGSGMVSVNDERRAYYHDGIAPGASIIGLGAGEGLSILYALLGFDYAIANQDRLGIDIITNSWGGGDGAEFDPNNPINKASFEAYSKGMVVSFAASNSGPDEDTLNQYAIAPWVINVAAGTSEKELADFSSRGVAGHVYKLPDITAPGQNITSTRAPNTVIGAMGPVVDLEHPEYAAYYHTISGTSMATPFVAGVAALLLEVNPDLSPDQIEQILKDSAEPMNYAPHEVGAGYIDVKAAVDLAKITSGNRPSFMSGNTQWSSQGYWAQFDNNNDELVYLGKWQTKSYDTAFQQSVAVAKNNNASIFAKIRGERVRFHFLATNSNPASIEVIMNGRSLGTETIYAANASETSPQEVVIAFDDLGEGVHDLEVRILNKHVMFDRIDVDGDLLAPDVSFSISQQINSGTMGVSAENLEVQEFPLEITPNDVSITSSLSWTGVADLDFYLVNPDGVEVASSASLENPEELQFWTDTPGTYTLRVTGYISIATPFTITTDITSEIK